jgi:hypothetical protein
VIGLIAACILVTLVSELLFVGRLATVRWWRTAEGRMTLLRETAILGVLLLAVVGAFVPDLPGRIYLRVGTWMLVAGAFVWHVGLLYYRQAEGRRLRASKPFNEEADP